ncbi:hypothetical protein [Streptomyces sp. NPDC055134]
MHSYSLRFPSSDLHVAEPARQGLGKIDDLVAVRIDCVRPVRAT